MPMLCISEDSARAEVEVTEVLWLIRLVYGDMHQGEFLVEYLVIKRQKTEGLFNNRNRG